MITLPGLIRQRPRGRLQHVICRSAKVERNRLIAGLPLDGFDNDDGGITNAKTCTYGHRQASAIYLDARVRESIGIDGLNDAGELKE